MNACELTASFSAIAKHTCRELYETYAPQSQQEKDHTQGFTLWCGLYSLCRPKESRSKISISAYP